MSYQTPIHLLNYNVLSELALWRSEQIGVLDHPRWTLRSPDNLQAYICMLQWEEKALLYNIQEAALSPQECVHNVIRKFKESRKHAQ